MPTCHLPICDRRLTVCPEGMSSIPYTDDNGCPQVECMCPPIPFRWCPHGNEVDQLTGCPQGKCKCGPIDKKYCQHGRVLDDEGCQTNTCSCPPVTQQYCPNGRVLDSNGCDTNECIETISPCELALTLCAPGMEQIVETDANGCNQTECLCPPTNRRFCPYGRVLDERNGCETNACACPPMADYCSFEGRWPNKCPAPRLGCRATIEDDSRKCQQCIGRVMRKGNPRPWAEKLCVRRNKCNDAPATPKMPLLGR